MNREVFVFLLWADMKSYERKKNQFLLNAHSLLPLHPSGWRIYRLRKSSCNEMKRFEKSSTCFLKLWRVTRKQSWCESCPAVRGNKLPAFPKFSPFPEENNPPPPPRWVLQWRGNAPSLVEAPGSAGRAWALAGLRAHGSLLPAVLAAAPRVLRLQRLWGRGVQARHERDALLQALQSFLGDKRKIIRLWWCWWGLEWWRCSKNEDASAAPAC